MWSGCPIVVGCFCGVLYVGVGSGVVPGAEVDRVWVAAGVVDETPVGVAPRRGPGWRWTSPCPEGELVVVPVGGVVVVPDTVNLEDPRIGWPSALTTWNARRYVAGPSRTFTSAVTFGPSTTGRRARPPRPGRESDLDEGGVDILVEGEDHPGRGVLSVAPSGGEMDTRAECAHAGRAASHRATPMPRSSTANRVTRNVDLRRPLRNPGSPAHCHYQTAVRHTGHEEPDRFVTRTSERFVPQRHRPTPRGRADLGLPEDDLGCLSSTFGNSAPKTRTLVNRLLRGVYKSLNGPRAALRGMIGGARRGLSRRLRLFSPPPRWTRSSVTTWPG